MVHSLSTLYRSWAFKVTTWLILAAIAGGLTVMVWIASAVKPAKSAVKAASNANQNQDPTALLLAKTPEEPGMAYFFAKILRFHLLLI